VTSEVVKLNAFLNVHVKTNSARFAAQYSATRATKIASNNKNKQKHLMPRKGFRLLKPSQRGVPKSSMSTPPYGEQMKNIMSGGYGKTLALMQGTRDFAEMYGNPFLKLPAKMPVYPVLPTQSTYSKSQGTFKTNSNGFGWIVVSPGWSVTNDYDCGYASNDPGASDAVGVPSASTTSFKSTSVYTASDFDALGIGTKAFRIYSLGMRVRYTGTNFNSAGRCYCVQSTLRDSVVGYDVNVIQSNQAWKTYPINNTNWHSLTRHITSKLDENFCIFNSGTTAMDYEYINLSSTDNMAYLCIYIAADPNQTFEFEIQSNYEVRGRNLNYQSIAKSDPNGVAKVTETYQRLRVKDNTTPDHSIKKTVEGTKEHVRSSLLDTIKDGFDEAVNIGSKVLPIATSILGLL
jgi:hypothetical protein